jgi:hypothetical protein
MLDDIRMTPRRTGTVGRVESSHPGRQVKGLLRADQTGVCARLWTGWGRIGTDPGRCRDRPVEDVGTTCQSVTYQQVNAVWEGVDNFLLRHAGHGRLGVSPPHGDRPLGASDRSLSDVGVTFRRATWTGGPTPRAMARKRERAGTWIWYPHSAPFTMSNRGE